MSMTSGAASGRRAFDEVAAAEANRPPPHHSGTRRSQFRIPTPKTADGWSSGLAIALAIDVPLWFYLSAQWNPAYTPTRGWVWGLPWIFAMVYVQAQVMFLLVSSGRSDKIGMGDLALSGLAFVSVLITTVVMVVLWWQGTYYLGGFQWSLAVALVFSTLSELVTTAWMRFLVNRRYFASVQGGGDTGDHHHADPN